ncbi:Hypothetical predicted protein [Mytilus galloprovincialis]|uniref:Uncharacterized protein n=1 Tax=Mytilus galloprovincialis TaxID=29158 RepID=A0A8B6D6T2_MYTGA|nr:Hypothetical predicted protein [Mytilus galloprovincialis]
MSTADEKKKYWCDQIKSMIGPCMITFAIPMMIPGFTITFVAFAEDNAFPKYGALHVVGIIILGIAFILLLFGCLLRFHWKPFISPDLEMHLSPMGSARRLQSDRIRSGSFKGERVKETQSESNSKSRHNGLATARDRMDNIPHVVPKTEVKPESETDGTASESELRRSLTGSIERNFDMISSPRSRNLRPVNSDSFDEDSNDASINHFEVEKSYEALQEFRRKKKRGKKRNQKEKLSDNETVTSKTLVSESLCEIDQHTKSAQNSESESDKKSKTNKQSEIIETKNSSPVETEKRSVNNTADKKTKRRKKKKKVLNSLRNEQERPGNKNSQIMSSMYESSVNASHLHNSQNEEPDSDQSNISIGSVDSVLAQYTSRSSKSQKDIP